MYSQARQERKVALYSLGGSDPSCLPEEEASLYPPLTPTEAFAPACAPASPPPWPASQIPNLPTQPPQVR